jgi:hypothetical protein
MNLEETKILMIRAGITQISITEEEEHLSSLQCPELMKGLLSLVSLKKISQFFLTTL